MCPLQPGCVWLLVAGAPSWNPGVDRERQRRLTGQERETAFSPNLQPSVKSREPVILQLPAPFPTTRRPDLTTPRTRPGSQVSAVAPEEVASGGPELPVPFRASSWALVLGPRLPPAAAEVKGPDRHEPAGRGAQPGLPVSASGRDTPSGHRGRVCGRAGSCAKAVTAPYLCPEVCDGLLHL